MSRNFLFVLCLVLCQKFIFGLSPVMRNYFYVVNTKLEIIDSVAISDLEATFDNNSRPNPLLHFFKSKKEKNKRITAAILAFPFPFGIVGLHRIYLGTAPYVPVAYIASLGGVFGVLPFIDFCVLILDKEDKRYVNNKKVFMWVN